MSNEDSTSTERPKKKKKKLPLNFTFWLWGDFHQITLLITAKTVTLNKIQEDPKIPVEHPKLGA